MARKKKTKVIKVRNWLAVHAFQRSGNGSHGDLRKKRSKTLCRGKVKNEIPQDN